MHRYLYVDTFFFVESRKFKISDESGSFVFNFLKNVRNQKKNVYKKKLLSAFYIGISVST